MVKVKKIGSITLFALAAIAVVGLFSSLFTKDSLGSSNGSHKHDFLITNSATCVSPGVETTLCLTCGYMSTREVDYAEHKYVLTESKATCMKEGFTVYDCRICGDHVETVVPSLGHVLENEICKNCGITVNYDLAYELNSGKDAYSIVGLGNCTSKDIIIPAYKDGIPITAIGEKAFLDSEINSVYIPATVTVIESYAFQHSTLREIFINSGVAEIKNQAFANNAYLACVTIPSSVTVIGNMAFENCDSLKKVIFSEGLLKIQGFAFYGCDALENVIIPDTVNVLENGVFGACKSLEYVVIPKGVNDLGQWVFRDCVSLNRIYFRGSKTQWESITKDAQYNMGAAMFVVYYYSEDYREGNYWHYVDGVPTLWNE